MLLLRHLQDFPAAPLKRASVVTIGAYDGLHLGHQVLLGRVLQRARANDCQAVVMSFEPMPKEFFAGGRPPARLMRFREKYDALRDFGMHIFYCPCFSPAMRSISAADFVRRILVKGLGARHLIVGDDFRFARRREGSLETLETLGRVLDFSVEAVPSVGVAGRRVSSTVIREALLRGNCRAATAFLGRPYRMSGRVVRGRCVGRSLGYPTANVDLRRRLCALNGIYAVRVCGLDEVPLDGVASVGTRPTFGLETPLLEVHLFDFDRDIYGAYIHVDFIERLRGVETYPTARQLVAQMERDADNARSILAKDAA